MKKYVIFTLLIVCFLFINIDSAGAASCSSGIVCSYEFCGLRGSASDPGYLSLDCPQNTGFVHMDIVFRCSDTSKNAGNCNSFESWAYAYKNTDGTSCYSIDSWGNYNDVFHHTDSLFKNYFKDNGNFTCPSIYVSLTNGTSNDTYTIGYVKPIGMDFSQSTQEGVENYINWMNIPATGRQFSASSTCINSSTNLDEIKNSTKAACDSTVQDKVEEDIQHNKENLGLNGETVNIQNIKDWAANAGYDIDSLGDPCTIISPSFKKMLTSFFLFIGVAGIILVVIMTSISFIKAITGSDEEKFWDAIKHLYTRIIVVIILLLLPMVLTFIIDLINNTVGEGEVSIGSNDEIFCDIDGGSSNDSTDTNETQ